MKIGSLAFIIGGLAALILALSSSSDTRPTRAECIAGAELLWSGKEGDRVPILNEIGAVFGLVLDYPVAANRLQQQERMYVIFTRDCENKGQMMDEIMAIFRQNIVGFPPHQIIEGPIEPSPNTIDVYGDEWSDGELPADFLE